MDNTFIKLWQIEDLSVCDDLIDYWKNSEKTPGANYSRDGNIVVNKTEKDSLDVQISVRETTSSALEKYLKKLQSIVSEYITEFPMCNQYSPWGLVDNITIQYYPLGGGYKTWHCERGSPSQPITTRHLVFMTYLNDVTDAGETEFFHQNLKIVPKKGLTVIWPADWTYTHRGIPSMTQEKYIITGWFNYIEIPHETN
jgi:hypothetical protein